jgi:hypothetical protein
LPNGISATVLIKVVGGIAGAALSIYYTKEAIRGENTIGESSS